VKNEDQHIDKLVQNLKGDSFEASASFIDDLKVRLDVRQKASRKRRFTLWFFLMSAILVGFVGITIYAISTNSHEELNTEIANSKSSTSENITSGDKNSANQQNTKVKDRSNLAGSVIISEKSKQENLTKETKTFTETEVRKKSNSKPKKKSKSYNTKKETKKGIKKGTPKTNLFLEGLNHDANNKKDDGLARESDINKDSKQIHTDYSREIPSKNQIVLPYLKMKQPVYNPIALALVRNNPNLLRTAKENNVELIKKFEVDLQVYGGVLLTSTKFNPTITAAGFNSKMFLSPSFGLKANVFYNNIYTSVGAEYFRTGDKIDFSSNSLSQVGIDSLFMGVVFDSVLINSIWEIFETPIYNTNPIFDSVTTQNTIRNQYSWISIPLSFGYRFKFNSWDVIPNIGMNFNFGVASNQGEYPTSNNQKVQYDAVKFNMNIGIQTEVRKSFDNYYVFASPYFRRHLQPTISNPSLRLTQNVWGINFGAGIKF